MVRSEDKSQPRTTQSEIAKLAYRTPNKPRGRMTTRSAANQTSPDDYRCTNVHICVHCAASPKRSFTRPMHDTFELNLDTDIQNLGRVGCALHNREVFDAYVELRLHGFHSSVAFRQAFSECYGITALNADNLHFARISAVDYNPYVTGRLRDRLAQVKPHELWNTNIAINEILTLARDPTSKCSTRLNAMKELNVLIGIVVIDENGKTKAGRSLDDFYRDVEPVAESEVLEVNNTDVVSSDAT